MIGTPRNVLKIRNNSHTQLATNLEKMPDTTLAINAVTVMAMRVVIPREYLTAAIKSSIQLEQNS